MKIWKSVVGKLWMTIIGLVAIVLLVVGFFLLGYIDFVHFNDEQSIMKLFIITGVIGFLLTTLFAFFLITKITQPLLQMKEAAAQIIRGDYSTRLLIRSSDEIGELAVTFNHMAEQLDATIRDLNHEKEHLGSVLLSMTDAVITCDADGKVNLTNPQGELLLSDWADLDWGGDEGATANPGEGAARMIPGPLRATFESVVRNGKEVHTKVHIRQGVWSVIMTPLYADRYVRGAVAVLRDVTEEHKLEKLRKDFVANVSHELRTPLAMLQGYSEALLDDIAGSVEQRRELARVIVDESQRMGRLVNNLLDLARMEAGFLELDLQPLDMRMLIDRVVRKFTALAKEHGVRLGSSFAGSADSLMLEAADEDKLEQVLTNLIDNALRHTGEGKSIEVAAKRIDWNGAAAVEVRVSDQGEGIPKEDLRYIFERFYKADKARTRHTGGTGLGLSIVRNIVEAHQGSVSAESEPGEGTTFSFIVPVRPT